MLLKQEELKIFESWNLVVVFPSLDKISGFAPGCNASIFQKILQFVFDLICVVIISSSAYYLSELANLNWLSQFLRKIVYISAQISELMRFHIKCSAKC